MRRVRAAPRHRYHGGRCGHQHPVARGAAGDDDAGDRPCGAGQPGAMKAKKASRAPRRSRPPLVPDGDQPCSQRCHAEPGADYARSARRRRRQAGFVANGQDSLMGTRRAWANRRCMVRALLVGCQAWAAARSAIHTNVHLGAVLRAVLLSTGAAILGGCANLPPPTPELADFDPQQGYRLTQTARGADNTSSLLAVLSFSGRGTRAAALAHGILK